MAKGKYEKEIKPYLDEIRKAVEAGATIDDIATSFKISKSTLYEYIKKHSEFSDALAHGRARVCINIKAALYKKAVGYQYTETKISTKTENGVKTTNKEITTKHQPPSETAAAMLLRNYDKTWLDHDSQSMDLRKQKAKLEKAIAQSNNFDLNMEE